LPQFLQNPDGWPGGKAQRRKGAKVKHPTISLGVNRGSRHRDVAIHETGLLAKEPLRMSRLSVEHPGAPAAAGADPAPPASAVRSGAGVRRDARRSEPNILLLDDDPFMLGLQSRMLRNMGYQKFGTAGSGEVALRMLQHESPPFDLILCDLNMPGMDGIEFLQRLNASPYCGSIILISGEGARLMHSVQKLLDGGRLSILGALEKPAGTAALGALLDSWRPAPAQSPARPAVALTVSELHCASREAQWMLHYQPKVDLRTGALAGMEALVRWNHPEHGLVYPDSFIGMAEDYGAIDSLTDWVLHEVTRQLARWRGQGLLIRAAVNVSMKNLCKPNFAYRVKDLMRDTFVSPQDVTLEITESRLMSGSPAPLENLVRLRMQGFRLSIDDFGTGHSSLAQLRDVPFTELKVDRGFVRGARHNQFVRPIVEGSIGIARRLGMQSVAEGVETEDDWHLVREIGCDLAQGYFIGRPMPADGLSEWMRLWQRRRPELVSR
jgi:EAL domain-containing protein (putative c-di-GMP-specific phosphodiesterase class I)/ActR/RegA family two-component response regulator